MDHDDEGSPRFNLLYNSRLLVLLLLNAAEFRQRETVPAEINMAYVSSSSSSSRLRAAMCHECYSSLLRLLVYRVAPPRVARFGWRHEAPITLLAFSFS